MNRLETRMFQLALAIGAGMWFARAVLPRKTANEARGTTRANDENAVPRQSARRFGALRGRVHLSEDFDTPMDLVPQKRKAGR